MGRFVAASLPARPDAQLLGAELVGTKYFDLGSLPQSRRFVLLGNGT